MHVVGDYIMHRVLIVHAEAEVRHSIETALRRKGVGPLVIHGSASVADGLRRARDLDPHVVFVDVGGERGLVLQALAEYRAPGRLIVGLYNPLLIRGDWSLLRDFTRAGLGDLIQLPPADDEVHAALASLEFREQRPAAEGTVVAYFSHQGGVGTTSLAINTAVLLAASTGSGSVVVCDAAVPFGSVAAQLGLNPVRDLAALVLNPEGGAALTACLTDEPVSGLSVLAAPRDPVVGSAITPDDVTRVLVELRRRFRWVVVDTSPSLDLLNLAVLDSADRVMVVTDAVTPTVMGASALLRLLDQEGFGPDRVSVILNKFSNFEGNLAERIVRERLSRPVNHVVPYDRQFVVAATRGRALASTRMAAPVQVALSSIIDDLMTPARTAGGAAR